MKKSSKILKTAGIICLVFLASVGVGLGGAAPILPKNRDRLIDTTVKTELIEIAKNNSTAADAASEFKS